MGIDDMSIHVKYTLRDQITRSIEMSILITELRVDMKLITEQLIFLFFRSQAGNAGIPTPNSVALEKWLSSAHLTCPPIFPH